MQSTKIEYLTHTWNPFAMRCTPISEGCANCWHLRMANRLSYNRVVSEEQAMAYGGEGPLLISKELSAPLHRIKPSIVGVQFMGDLFHETITNEQIAAVFGVMAATQQHQYVVMTKRLQRALEWFEWVDKREIDGRGLFPYDDNGWRIRQMLNHCVSKNGINPPPHHGGPWPIENVIMCASVEDQPTVNERVPLLLQIPARWRGVSVEPMLGPVRLDDIVEYGNETEWHANALECDVDPEDDEVWKGATLDLVIGGAETGPGKRPFKDEWTLDLRDQCKAAGVPFFFKRDGAGNSTLCWVEYHEWIS